MRFSSPFTTLWPLTALALLGAASGLWALFSYHGSLWSISALSARPAANQGGSGPVKLSGQARGTPITLPPGEQALAATIELWSAAPTRKNSKRLCRRALLGEVSINDVRIAFDVDDKPIETADDASRGPGARLLELGRAGAAVRANDPRWACPGATHAVVRLLKEGDHATVFGCQREGTVVPCDDGRDAVVSGTLSEATRSLERGKLSQLWLAALLGCPSLLALVLSLSRGAASLSPRGSKPRPAEEA